MATDTDKIVAATLAAAMLRPLEPTGSPDMDAKQRIATLQLAGRLYRDILATLQEPVTEPSSTPES